MKPVVLIVVKIPKNIAIQIVVDVDVDVVCCTSTDELSENVVDLVSAVVIPFVVDVELCKKKTRDQ